MSAYCSLEEAFTGPTVSKKKKRGGKEHFVPAPLSGTPDVAQEADEEEAAPAAMSGAPASAAQPNAAIPLNDFFPLPGATAQPEEWAKAFTLMPSQLPASLLRPDGSIPVAGKSTLWRNIQVPAATSTTTLAAAPLQTGGSVISGDIQQRLDALTKQLDSLTTVTPMQSTAELFLFVAIGLIFLLAIDTLLRFATTMASRQQGGYRGRAFGRGGLSRRW
jgi:hypothetical protein